LASPALRKGRLRVIAETDYGDQNRLEEKVEPVPAGHYGPMVDLSQPERADELDSFGSGGEAALDGKVYIRADFLSLRSSTAGASHDPSHQKWPIHEYPKVAIPPAKDRMGEAKFRRLDSRLGEVRR
jgi:hypothetical protein